MQGDVQGKLRELPRGELCSGPEVCLPRPGTEHGSLGEIQFGVTTNDFSTSRLTFLIDRGKRRDQLYDYGAVMFDKFKSKSKIIGKVVTSLKDEENKDGVGQVSPTSASRWSLLIRNVKDRIFYRKQSASQPVRKSSHESKSSGKDSDERRKSSVDHQLSEDSDVSASGPRLLTMNRNEIKGKLQKNIDNPDLLELEKNIAAKIGSLFSEKMERNMSSLQED